MIDIVMNLSLPLPPYLIFTASFQNYLIITVHMVFFILYMRHAVGLVFSHLEHDLLWKWCNDCIYMYIHVRYCFTSPFPGMIKILKLWSSLKGMHIVFCFKMYSRISLKCTSRLIFWCYFKAWLVQNYYMKWAKRVRPFWYSLWKTNLMPLIHARFQKKKTPEDFIVCLNMNTQNMNIPKSFHVGFYLNYWIYENLQIKV